MGGHRAPSLRHSGRHKPSGEVAGETAGQPGRLALKRGLAWTGIWALLFLLYILILGLGSLGM